MKRRYFRESDCEPIDFTVPRRKPVDLLMTCGACGAEVVFQDADCYMGAVRMYDPFGNPIGPLQSVRISDRGVVCTECRHAWLFAEVSYTDASEEP